MIENPALSGVSQPNGGGRRARRGMIREWEEWKKRWPRLMLANAQSEDLEFRLFMAFAEGWSRAVERVAAALETMQPGTGGKK